MSRVGNSPITVPAGVTIEVKGSEVVVTGPKGTLTQFTMDGITIKQDGDQLTLTRSSEDKPIKAKHGLMRALLNNMIVGVTDGFKKQLEVNGVGFKVALQGKTLKMALGFSHEVLFELPEDVDGNVDGNIIVISGISKQKVGQVAAEIRALKKPEPYKGKGIRYSDEYVIRKAGKTGGK